MGIDVQLRPVARSDARFLSVLLNSYLIDVAPGAKLDAAKMVDRIWDEDGRYGLWIMDGPKRVGFAMVRDAEGGARELSEFCILGAYRRRQIGRAAAHALLNELPGTWFLGVSAKAKGAQDFWHKVLEDCPSISNLKSGPPQNDQQSETLHFEIGEDGDEPASGNDGATRRGTRGKSSRQDDKQTDGADA